MGKPNDKTPATEPPPVVIDDEPVPATEPAPNYPPGVSMHQAGMLPNTTDRESRIARDPKAPPPGWKGSVVRCGGCGDFLGNLDRCPSCAPSYVPSNTMNHPVKA